MYFNIECNTFKMGTVQQILIPSAIKQLYKLDENRSISWTKAPKVWLFGRAKIIIPSIFLYFRARERLFVEKYILLEFTSKQFASKMLCVAYVVKLN